MAKLVAKAYGEALFELAMEKQNPEIFLEEAGDFADFGRKSGI